MMFYTFNLLVVLMALTGNKNYIAFLCHHARCFDSFLAIGNGDYFLHFIFVQPSYHVVYNVLWLFKTGIVAGYNHTVALSDGFLCHEWTLSLVTIAPRTAYSYYFSLAVQHPVNSI